MENKVIEEFVYNELSRFNFKKSTKGYKYLAEAIIMCIKEENSIDNLSKNIFPRIAIKYKAKNANNVKWCIDQVIKTMYNNTKSDLIYKYFNIEENTKTSLKLIIYTIMCKYERKFEK